MDPDALADRIEAAVPAVAAITGKEFDESIGSATSILIGIALISLVVGGLSVVNAAFGNVVLACEYAVSGPGRRAIDGEPELLEVDLHPAMLALALHCGSCAPSPVHRAAACRSRGAAARQNGLP